MFLVRTNCGKLHGANKGITAPCHSRAPRSSVPSTLTRELNSHSCVMSRASGVAHGACNTGTATTVDTDPTYGPADSNVISSNKVSGTQIFDAIDLCSSSNSARTNTVYGSAESGIHVDDSCGSGNNNTVTGNTINEACAGVLLGTGTGNVTSPNTFFNVTNTTLAGDVCTPTPQRGAKRSATKPRPSPFTPNRK